eukprot:scaffold6151_cov129-Isochrysis_galbana.AAC.2
MSARGLATMRMRAIAHGLELRSVLEHLIDDAAVVADELRARQRRPHLELVESMEVDVTLAQPVLVPPRLEPPQVQVVWPVRAEGGVEGRHACRGAIGEGERDVEEAGPVLSWTAGERPDQVRLLGDGQLGLVRPLAATGLGPQLQRLAPPSPCTATTDLRNRSMMGRTRCWTNARLSSYLPGGQAARLTPPRARAEHGARVRAEHGAGVSPPEHAARR